MVWILILYFEGASSVEWLCFLFWKAQIYFRYSINCIIKYFSHREKEMLRQENMRGWEEKTHLFQEKKKNEI